MEEMDSESKKIPTNEEIIEDLTKGLADSCVKEKPLVNDESFNEEFDKDEDDKSKAKDEDKTKVPEDFVDEEKLKDREVSLSEDDKQELRIEAETLKSKGNDLFVASEFHEAVKTYTAALHTCPLAYDKDRSILYANRAAAKSKYDDKESAITDCTKALELNSSYLKAYVRRAQLYEQTDKLDEALADFQKILELDPRHNEANQAVRRLPPLIQEKNEKLKTEMLGKLKDLGNIILKPFGLSTNNFKMEQDPNTGGYSVKFNQN